MERESGSHVHDRAGAVADVESLFLCQGQGLGRVAAHGDSRNAFGDCQARIFGIPDFRLYALSDALRKLFTRYPGNRRYFLTGTGGQLYLEGSHNYPKSQKRLGESPVNPLLDKTIYR